MSKRKRFTVALNIYFLLFCHVSNADHKDGSHCIDINTNAHALALQGDLNLLRVSNAIGENRPPCFYISSIDHTHSGRVERLASPWKRAFTKNTSENTARFYRSVADKGRRLCLNHPQLLRVVQICASCGAGRHYGSVVCSVGPRSEQLHADCLPLQQDTSL